MTLEEEVKYLIIKHDYSKGGVDTLVPEVIALVLDEAIDIIHTCDYLDAIDKHDLETDIEKLKAIS